MNTIEITTVRRIAEYRVQYPGQFRRQPAYICLDPESEPAKLYATYNAEIGGAVSMACHLGRELRFGFDADLKVKEVNDLLHQIAPLAQRIVDGYSTRWDGNNTVGHLTQDALQAVHEIDNILG